MTSNYSRSQRKTTNYFISKPNSISSTARVNQASQHFAQNPDMVYYFNMKRKKLNMEYGLNR